MSRGFAARQEVGYSNLLSLSLRNLALIWRQVLVYLAVVALLGLAAPVIGSRSTGLVGLALYFAGQYWLFRSLLKQRGLLATQRIHYLAFVGLAALLILPIMLGLAALLLPGLFLVARWIAAPAFIVARGESVFAAIGASSAAVRGITIRVIAAMVVLVLIVVAISAVFEAVGGPGGRGRAGVLDLVAGHLIPLMLLGLSVATYELLGATDEAIEDIFG